MNTKSLKSLCYTLWKTKFERRGLNTEWIPEYVKYIGIDNDSSEEEYNSILALIHSKASEDVRTLLFINEIPVVSDFDLLMYVSKELETIDIDNLYQADITMFQDSSINALFLKSLQEVVNDARKDSFVNKSSLYDFIQKMILWTYAYLGQLELSYDDTIPVKCFYYGDIKPHEVHFLHMLHLIGFDVIYINPLRNNSFGRYNPTEIINSTISPIGNYLSRISNVRPFDINKSFTAQVQDNIRTELFTNTGMYQPWQLRSYHIKPIPSQGTIYDMLDNVNEDARLRKGFEVSTDTIRMPNLFYQIDGIHDNFTEYVDIVKKVTSNQNKMVITNNNVLSSIIKNPESLNLDNMYQFTFTKISDGVYDDEKIKELPDYKWHDFNDDVQNSLLEAINKLFSDNIIRNPLSESQEFKLLLYILNLQDDIIRMLDNFDYPFKIPKIIIFLEKDDFIETEGIYLLAYLYELGFDILIFNPSGMKSINTIINSSKYTYIRLEKMSCEITFSKVIETNEKGFFAKLFSLK